MPIYEYKCSQCKKRSTILVLNRKDSPALKCKYCGSTDIQKMISRVRMIKSEEARLESLTDPGNLTGLDENDPVSMAKWMKKMGKEMGEDMAGEEFDQMVDEAAHEAEQTNKGEGSEPSDLGEG